MLHQFPQQYAHITHPPTHSAQASEHSQSLLIDQLRRENQMLKQQLQAVLRMQAQSPPPTQRPNSFLPLALPLQVQNLEEEAENAYRNKMSKLKKKSNRKSYDQSATAPISPHQSATAPISPQASFLRYGQPQVQQVVPKLMIADPPCKMMVISKDKQGKFFRDRTQEEHIHTLHKANTSQERKGVQQERKGVQQNYETAKEDHFGRTQKAHQRVVSAFPVNSLDKTERNGQTTPAPSMNHVPNRPTFARSPQFHRKTEPNQNQRPPIYHPFPPTILNLKANNESRLPRGNVYFEEAEERARVQQKESVNDLTSEGDSRLSIEIGLRNARSARRLNYGIYLQEDRS